MILFMVTYSDYDEYGIRGLYSTKEAAETHQRLDREAAKINGEKPEYLDVEEIELSSEAPFIHYSYELDWRGKSKTRARVGDVIPETHVYSQEIRDKQTVLVGYAYGRTPEEAKAKLETAIAEH